MDPLDPAHAPFRCWEHEDCLEHPELAFACAGGEPFVMRMYPCGAVAGEGQGWGDGNAVPVAMRMATLDDGIAIFVHAYGRGDGCLLSNEGAVEIGNGHILDPAGFPNDDDLLMWIHHFSYFVGW